MSSDSEIGRLFSRETHDLRSSTMECSTSIRASRLDSSQCLKQFPDRESSEGHFNSHTPGIVLRKVMRIMNTLQLFCS